MPLDAQYLKLEAPQKRKRRGEYRTCPQCDRTFYLVPMRVARNETYCSKSCELASVPRVDKLCPVCGKTFTVLVSVADRYTVCSRACRTAATKYVTCKRCGKVFRAEKYLNRAYCSEECRRPPVMIHCKTCGKELRICPGNTERQFCSFACYRRHKGETLLEVKVRESLTRMGLHFVQELSIGRWSADFALPDIRLIIEADGDYWHQNVTRDARKTTWLQKHGWRLIRVKESELDNCIDIDRFLVDRLNGKKGLTLPGI